LVVCFDVEVKNDKDFRGIGDFIFKIINQFFSQGTNLHLYSKFVHLGRKGSTLEILLSTVQKSKKMQQLIYTLKFWQKISQQQLFLPHGTFKDLGINFEQRDGLVGTHFALLAIEHGLEHITGHRENHLVAFEVLKCVHNFIEIC